jgi:hypothetical protein
MPPWRPFYYAPFGLVFWFGLDIGMPTLRLIAWHAVELP